MANSNMDAAAILLRLARVGITGPSAVALSQILAPDWVESVSDVVLAASAGGQIASLPTHPDSGWPLGLPGTTASRYVGGTLTGAPTGGTFQADDFVVAADGYVWVCTVGGSPGTWVSRDSGGGATSIPAWAASTVYAANAPVLSPVDGSIITAKTAHTSGASFTPANWNTPGSATLVSTLGLSNGTDDIATIQAALTAARVAGRGYVRGKPGQNYLISAPLVIGPETTLDMAGCTVTLITGSVSNLLYNYAAGPPGGTASPARAVADAATTAVSATLTSATAAFTSADVGRSVQVAGAAGFVGNSTTVRAGLTAIVGSVTDASTVQLVDLLGNPITAAVTVSGAALTITPRDTNIEVAGGRWVKNDGGSGLNAHGLRLRHIDGLKVHDLKCQSAAGSGSKFFIAPADCRDWTIKDITGNVPSAMLQGNGPLYDGRVERISGVSQDDFVAFGTAEWQAVNETQGDITDLVISGVYPDNTTTGVGNAVHLFSGSGTKLARITTEKIRGRMVNSAVVVDTGSTLRQDMDADAITCRDIKPTAYGAYLIQVLNGSIHDLVTDDLGVNTAGVSKTALVNLETLTGDSVRIRNTKIRNGAASMHMARANACTLSTLMVDGLDFNSGAGHVVNVLGTSTLTRILMSNVTGTGGGSALVSCSVAAATIPQIQLVNVQNTGWAWIVSLATSTRIDMHNVAHLASPNGILNCYATGNLKLRGHGLNITGTGIYSIATGGIVSILTEALIATTVAGGVPTLTAQGGLGSSGYSVAVNGTDKAGNVTLTTGVTPVAGGLVKVSLTQNNGLVRTLTITPTNAAAASAGLYLSQKTAVDFTVSAVNAPTGNMTFDYVLGGV